MRRLAAALLLAIAALTFAAPAQALGDTNWPCHGCVKVGR